MTPDRASLRRIEDGYAIPPAAIGEAAACAPDLSPGLDDRTTTYILQARGPFEGLRRAASQLAGLLVLAAIGSRTAQGNPMLELAIAAHERATQDLQTLTPTAPAAHHHLHLCRAAERLGEALKIARHSLHIDDAVSDRISTLMRQGLDDLRWASRALPGFALVNLSQGCCAMHGAALKTETKKKPVLYSTEERS